MSGEGEGPHFGAVVDHAGTRFAVLSGVADRVEVCLFDADGREADRVELEESTGDVRHGHVAGVAAGQRYGYRAWGPFDPAAGHRCDPAKLLVDPAARGIDGALIWSAELLAPGVDSAPWVPRSVVANPLGLPGSAATSGRARHPLDQTIIYETNVEAFTAGHPLVPSAQRGTYAALAHEAVLHHLTTLGVTTVELLPVHHFVSEQRLVQAGRRNVWGYNPLAWSAPHAGYAAPGANPTVELRDAIDGLHRAGIDVWVDVVFNHTAEGPAATGPTLSLRGLDAAGCYRLRSDPHGGPDLIDDDVTGCGNTVDLRHPELRRMVRECLVQWVVELGVDGFRFDLAAALMRGDHGPDPLAPLLSELAAEPTLAGVALVAEPWDLGPDGYQLGGFGPRWSEWNDKFRDDVRDMWRGVPGSLQGWATRLTGSADVFRAAGRSPQASINLVTAHDGFTLADLVAHDRKSNHANGEDGADGHEHNRSWNGGVEGPTHRSDVLANRSARQRSLLATLLSAQGIPLLSGGDEIGRSQRGNNNGYALDDGSAWFSWSTADGELRRWVADAIALRREHPVLRRKAWLDDGPDQPVVGVTWLHPVGRPMTSVDWHDPLNQAVLVVLDGSAVDDGVLLLAANGSAAAVTAALPEGRWRLLLDSTAQRAPGSDRSGPLSATVVLAAFGFLVLELVAPELEDD